MTTCTPMAIPRQPFAVLKSPRLQYLTSIKNRQMGLNSSPMAKGKSFLSSTPTKPSPLSATMPTSTKRRLTLEDNDAENLDPATCLSPNKRTKGNDSTPIKPVISSPKMTFSKPLPGFQTPRKQISSVRAPSTAPARRSPVTERTATGKRRTSAPYTRIEPPRMTSASAPLSFQPFSLDQALCGTLKASKPKAATRDRGVTIGESLPKSWVFNIYRDSADEEAATLMEHSTLVLDLSSDEEGSASYKLRNDRGKENCPPGHEYDVVGQGDWGVGNAPSRARWHAGEQVGVRRRKVVPVDQMDDGSRFPLSDLAIEDFFAQGLSRESVVLVS